MRLAKSEPMSWRQQIISAAACWGKLQPLTVVRHVEQNMGALRISPKANLLATGALLFLYAQNLLKEKDTRTVIQATISNIKNAARR